MRELKNMEDLEFDQFLKPYIISQEKRAIFINKIGRKLKTRRIVSLLQWYSEIANGIRRGRYSRSALQIIFLTALAEATVKYRLGKKKPADSFANINACII